MARQSTSPLGAVGAAWGLAGACGLLVKAIWSLAPLAAEALGAGLAPWQWAAGVAWAALLGYLEGYRGFQRGFSPRVVARAFHLTRQPRALDVALAPLFCMGLIRATRRRLITSWLLVAMIAALVAGVRHVPQPYRGLIDAGVVAALAWGLAAISVFTVRALRGRPPAAALDLPLSGGR